MSGRKPLKKTSLRRPRHFVTPFLKTSSTVYTTEPQKKSSQTEKQAFRHPTEVFIQNSYVHGFNPKHVKPLFWKSAEEIRLMITKPCSLFSGLSRPDLIFTNDNAGNTISGNTDIKILFISHCMVSNTSPIIIAI